MRAYPESTADEMPFDEVVVYDVASEYSRDAAAEVAATKIAIVTYGNGVRTALQYAHAQAREAKQQQQQQRGEGVLHITVIDSPCISQTPSQLRDILPKYAPRTAFRIS
jgi:hypothetical protein